MDLRKPAHRGELVRPPRTSSYDELAARITARGIIGDPWIDGVPRFAEEPVVLDQALASDLARAAESIAALYDELCEIVVEEPRFLDEFFALTPFQRAMWLASEPLWHGIARADLFVTREGLAVAELNCDTPTGEAEAVELGAVAIEQRPGLIDPNRDLEGHFQGMIEAITQRELDGDRERRRAAIIYPTEMTDDLALVRLYKRWLQSSGFEVALGSPYNLGFDGERARLFDAPVDLVVRHYKTDWWGERSSAWLDEDLADREPLTAPLRALLAAQAEGKLAIVNPFGAVLPQNKRAMAFFWEHIHRFGREGQETIRRYVPVSARLETVHEARLMAERDDWVMKSDYGAEGEEVILGRNVTEEAWRASIALARPGRWIAQRYFDAVTDDDGATTNLGVFLVAGVAAGLYGRRQRGATDARASSVAVLLSPA